MIVPRTAGAKQPVGIFELAHTLTSRCRYNQLAGTPT
jgi:hypothetical protein